MVGQTGCSVGGEVEVAALTRTSLSVQQSSGADQQVSREAPHSAVSLGLSPGS